MKRLILLSGFLFFFLSAFSQNADSLLAAKQVDSLIQISRALTKERDFDKALEVNAAAEKIALSRSPGMGRESAAYGSTCFNQGRVLYFKGDYPEAEKWYLEALAIRSRAPGMGKEHPDYAWSLNNLAQLYLSMRHYEKAEPLHLEARAIRAKVLGKEHTEYVQSLTNLATLYRSMGHYVKAIPFRLEVKDIQEKTLGKEHHEYAANLGDLANLYYYMGNYAKAEALHLETKAIREKVLGKEHPDYAATLNNLALLYVHIGQYEKGEELHLEAKAIKEKVLGKEHPDYCGTLINLADLYRSMGNFEKAELLCLEAKEIFEVRLNNRSHAFYLSCLNNLATLYRSMGNYEKAEPLSLEAKVILEKTVGKEHPHYANILTNLSYFYLAMGNYEKAEPLSLEAKVILEKVVGKEHPHYAATLLSLAELYTDLGNYEKSESLYFEAKAIYEKVYGKEHRDYANLLGNLANLYGEMGRYEKAEPLFLEAMDIWKKAGGMEHPDYTINQHNLAQLYRFMGRYEKAESLYLEAKTILEKILAKEHHNNAKIQVNLALLYRDMGQYEKAGLLCRQAEATLEKVWRKELPDYVKELGNLASLYVDLANYEKAGPLFIELANLNQRSMTRALHHLSERELNGYLKRFSRSQNYTLSLAQLTQGNAGVSGQGISQTCYDNTLFHKGFLLNAANQVKRLALSDSVSTEKFNSLKGYGRRLAAQYALPIGERKGVEELEAKSSDLEKELARMVAGYGEAMRQVKWQEVQAALKPGEAAVEFVNYRFYGKKQTDSTIYAALILMPGDPGALAASRPFGGPKFIPIFEQKQLDSLLATGLGTGERKADYVNHLYTVAQRGPKPLGKPQKSLYELLWKPLEKDLEHVKTIYFSSSGLLHRLNIGAIAIDEAETLADRYRLVELGSTRQLVIRHLAVQPAGTAPVGSGQALLFGGIQYEMDSTAIAAANIGLENSGIATRGSELGFAQTDSTARGGSWNYLTWTEKEVTALETILTTGSIQPTVRKGYSATEEAFKSIGKSAASPRILHIATHGFFFPDPELNPQSVIRNPQSDEPVFKLSDHPMIRSGLLLAGGNHAWTTGKPLRPDMEDGILTAYEISQMNLSNTELVVLSACETGLGDISGNEGVYGLQRAFKIAGAKYLIMSLWQVPDRQTSLLMTTFYKKWLEEKMAIPEAFRAAQKELREAGLDPYQWAGFVLVE